MTKTRDNEYYEEINRNPRMLDNIKKKEKLDYFAYMLIKEFDLLTNFVNREILQFRNNSYGSLNERFYDRVNLELSGLETGSYKTDKANLLEIIKDRSLIREKDFSWDQWIIIFRNGTYDITTDIFYPIIELIETDDRTFKNRNLQGKYFYEISQDYEEGSFTCRRFKKALISWIDEKTAKHHRKGRRILLLNDIFEQIGLSFSMNTLFKKASMNLGEKNSGKTQLTNILIGIIGKSNITSQSIQDLCNNRFSTKYLQYKIANIRSENPSTQLKNVEMFKALTGDDSLIPAEIKNGASFQFRNVSKFWFNCNKAPNLRNDDDAFYDRFIINQFPNNFENNHKILNFARNHILNDPNEVQGIIHEAIKGFKRLYERQGFRQEILQNTRHLWNYSNNLTYQFMYDYCLRNTTFKIKVDTLFTEFKEKTEDTNIEKGVFTRNLQKFGITKKQKRPSREYYYIGIKLKEEENQIENRLFTQEIRGNGINE